MTDNDDQAMRDFTKALFSHADEPDEALPPQRPAGVVPTESGTPNPAPRDPMRDFVAGLFSNRD